MIEFIAIYEDGRTAIIPPGGDYDAITKYVRKIIANYQDAGVSSSVENAFPNLHFDRPCPVTGTVCVRMAYLHRTNFKVEQLAMDNGKHGGRLPPLRRHTDGSFSPPSTAELYES